MPPTVFIEMSDTYCDNCALNLQAFNYMFRIYRYRQHFVSSVILYAGTRLLNSHSISVPVCHLLIASATIRMKAVGTETRTFLIIPFKSVLVFAIKGTNYASYIWPGDRCTFKTDSFVLVAINL